MRCPNCNKFVSYDEPSVEVDAQPSNDDSVDLNIRIVLPCAECSEELKEAVFDESIDIVHECSAADVVLPEGDEVFEVEDAEGVGTDRVENKTKDGKIIKNYRYMKKFYGADVTVTLKCNRCKETFDLNVQVEEQASGFNELV